MDVATLNDAMTPNDTPDEVLAEYLPHFEAAMVAAEINTVNRSAAWCAQIGAESAGLKYMAEIQTNGPGWTQDRRIYRGRGPIQLTWSGNYRKFGQWCQQQGYIDDPELFVREPTLVEQPRWGFLAASWYWLFGGPRPGEINDFADAGDILAVSRCVNGWVDGQMPHGWEGRLARWNHCLTLGQALLPANTAGNDGGNAVGISGDPVWLEDVLREALGDRLVVEADWKERGVGGTMGEIWGTMIHHTGSVNETLEHIRDGVDQGPPNGWLQGPLSQGFITSDGIFHLVAVGPCNHAGGGYWGTLTDGNRQAIGFECAYNGSGPWPQKQVITMRDASAAVSKKLGKRAQDSVVGHKEYAKPQGRKPDPGNMDMNWFRAEVQKDLDGFHFPGENQEPEHPPITPPPPTNTPPSDEEIMYYANVAYWEMLGWRTPTEAMAVLLDAVTGSKNAGKPGVSLTRPKE